MADTREVHVQQHGEEWVLGGPGAEGFGVANDYLGYLAELNRLFTAWVEGVYHRRVHTETGQAPLARWLAGGPLAVPIPADLAEAFRWSEHRTVSKTALVSLHGTATRSTPPWSAVASSWSSTRST